MDLQATIHSNLLDQGEKDIAIGARAEAFFNDELTQLCVSRIRQDYIEQILNSKPEQAETRETAYRMIRALDQLVGEYKAVENRGKVAQARRRKQ